MNKSWEAHDVNGVWCVFEQGTGRIVASALDRDQPIARLIAAAPDLLEACKRALGAFEHNHAIDWSILSDAIAKAEGTP